VKMTSVTLYGERGLNHITQTSKVLGKKRSFQSTRMVIQDNSKKTAGVEKRSEKLLGTNTGPHFATTGRKKGQVEKSTTGNCKRRQCPPTPKNTASRAVEGVGKGGQSEGARSTRQSPFSSKIKEKGQTMKLHATWEPRRIDRG